MKPDGNFAKILDQKMRENTSHDHFQSPREAPSLEPLHMAFLLGKIQKTELPRRGKSYFAARKQASRKAHNLNENQKASFEFLKRWAQDLSDGFTLKELKKAFWQAARALHPDFGGNQNCFIELKKHYEQLSQIAR